MAYSDIKLALEGPIGTLTLARPEARNAMGPNMGQEIQRAVAEVNAATGVRVLLVRGEGAAFAAGGDFRFIEERLEATPEQNRFDMGRFYRLFLSIRDVRVPTIAVLHGAAVGAGLCFALACDLRLCAKGARLGMNFVKLGLHPGMGATWLVTRLCGPARATELLLSGRFVTAEEAERLGLVNAAIDPEDLDTEARRLAEEIALNAPVAVMQTKASLQRALSRSLEEQLEEEAYAQAIDYATLDFQEGIAAARAKRPPVFQGR